jgi:hypothetical protein
MIVGVVIGLALWGLMTLVIGFARLAPFAPVRGWRARLIGLTAFLPAPLIFVAGYGWAEVAYRTDSRPTLDELRWWGRLIEIGAIAVTVGLMYLLAWRWGRAKGTRTEP